MRTHLEFRSAALADPAGVGNSINPEIHGQRLAEFLSEQFAALGYDGGVIEEDWGWMVMLASEPFRMWLGCASYDDPDGWLVFIEPSKPAIRKWFRKIDTQAAVDSVANQLEQVLLEKGSATGLKWWSDRDSGRK